MSTLDRALDRTPRKITAPIPAPTHNWGQQQPNPLGFWQRNCKACGASIYLSAAGWSAPSSNACDWRRT